MISASDRPLIGEPLIIRWLKFPGDILQVANYLVAYYTNAETDLRASWPIPNWRVAPAIPAIDSGEFELIMDKAGVWTGPMSDDDGEWICPPFFVRFPSGKKAAKTHNRDVIEKCRERDNYKCVL
ncbi:uncharacterized protein N7446_013481 [Penicillium canescens]|uniref:uncharacterized protein n=1 Tax=Penicillium canescens TaxID=5083 RepID=UPI0026E07088|nr:uncharacterized protein N7446_013481 [Penicillium canescens]KAJ6042415.1 hypothetical protein N7446_013481 [Penicillium canescens]